MNLYIITTDQTGFKVGTWIVKKGNSLFVVVDKNTMQRARMTGYLKLFKEWIKFGSVVEVKK